ncbi:MAG: hemolysin III family protein [Desulfuromonadales bacterium]|nr:hemolysin III family protein [Desulfuromonadales bacterium]MBN2792440.1 hemolysin III family protein [Desulfuromonadales bacterium]
MKKQTPREELFNSLLHTLGAAGAIAGLVILLYKTTDPWRIISFSVFCGTMIVLYSTSALYHALMGRAKKIIKKLDHLAIYLLIAGTYTPFTLVVLRDSWGWVAFGVIWGLAFIGISYDLLPRKNDSRAIPVTIYLLMGWLSLLLAKPLLTSLSLPAFIWLLCGGLFYTCGLIFYAFDDRVRYFHAVWHSFVLLGSFFHFMTVYLYIA